MKNRVGLKQFVGLGVAAGLALLAVHSNATEAMPGFMCNVRPMADARCGFVEDTGRARSTYRPTVWMNSSPSASARNCLQSEDDTTFSCGNWETVSGNGVIIVKPSSFPANWNNGLWGFAYIEVQSAIAPLGYAW